MKMIIPNLHWHILKKIQYTANNKMASSTKIMIGRRKSDVSTRKV